MLPFDPPVDVEPPGMMEFAPSYCPLLTPVSVEGKAFQTLLPWTEPCRAGRSHMGVALKLFVIIVLKLK